MSTLGKRCFEISFRSRQGRVERSKERSGAPCKIYRHLPLLIQSSFSCIFCHYMHVCVCVHYMLYLCIVIMPLQGVCLISGLRGLWGLMPWGRDRVLRLWILVHRGCTSELCGLRKRRVAAQDWSQQPRRKTFEVAEHLRSQGCVRRDKVAEIILLWIL